jgi:hypothetical protein
VALGGESISRVLLLPVIVEWVLRATAISASALILDG